MWSRLNLRFLEDAPAFGGVENGDYAQQTEGDEGDAHKVVLRIHLKSAHTCLRNKKGNQS